MKGRLTHFKRYERLAHGALNVLRVAIFFACLCALLVATIHSAEAQTETVLYSFGGSPDGQRPYGALVMGANGNLYGTTFVGGAHNYGSVFQLTPAGAETVLHSFNVSDGEHPYAGLVFDGQGNLYGTTEGGGAYSHGTVFKLTPAGAETILHSFAGPTGDGAYPYGGLIIDGQGNLYGTTSAGGTQNHGTVFKLTPAGAETVLYSFAGLTTGDGVNPHGGLIIDGQGNLYGTTEAGGSLGGHGTVFKLTPAGTETVLHSFNGSDGDLPYAGLVMDAQGNLYGTTWEGGAYLQGTVFKVTATGTETVLHSFENKSTGHLFGGALPYAGVVMDGQGNLYGTTYEGGTGTTCLQGCGTVYKLASDGTFAVLYSFAAAPDGQNPYAGLIMDGNGNLYGTTSSGGASSNCSSGCGTVFKVAP